MGLMGVIKGVVNGLSKVASAIKDAFQIKQIIKDKVNKLRRKWKLYVSAAFLIMLIPVLILQVVLGGVTSFVESITDFFANKEMDITEFDMNDAGSLYEVMSKTEYDPFAEEIYLLDKETIMRILKKVSEYNKGVAEPHEISYTYRVEKGKLQNMPDIDDYGNLAEVLDETEWIEVDEKTAKEKIDRNGEQNAPVDSEMSIGATQISNDGKITKNTPASGDAEKQTSSQKDYTKEMIEASVVLRRDSIDYGSAYADVADNIFYMRWQPIVALACMYIQNEDDSWGTYEVTEEVSEDGVREHGSNYYLSNADIDRLIAIYEYDYEFKSDVTYAEWWQIWGGKSSIKFDEFRKGKSAFKIDIDTIRDGAKGEFTRITRYIPHIAPVMVRNSYMQYTYNYTTLDNGDEVLTERVINISYSQLMDEIRREIPSFSESVFLAQLMVLPGAVDLCTYYSDTVFPMAEEGGIVSSSTSDSSECPVIGVIVCGNDKTLSGGSGKINLTEGSMGIKLYPVDGWPGYESVYLRPAPHIVEGDNEYGIYEVTPAALASLSSPDNVTLSQIKTFLKKYKFDTDGVTRKNCPLLASDDAIEDTAQCLFNFQIDTGASISGLFGIILQEGGLRSASLGRMNWNFFSITADRSWGYATVEYNNHKFKDYKDKYETVGCKYDTLAVGAFEEQLYMVYNNYWANGQNTYYLMVWNKTEATDVDYSIYAGISHSYCPPWQDRSMPFSKDSHAGNFYYWSDVGEGHTGWVNKCGVLRESVLTYLQSAK